MDRAADSGPVFPGFPSSFGVDPVSYPPSTSVLDNSDNKNIEVEIPSDNVGQPGQRVVISVPMKRPWSGDPNDPNFAKVKKRDFQYISLAAKKALCVYKRDHPKASQQEIKAYLDREFDIKRIPSSTLSTILANADKYLSLDDSQATTGRVKLRPGNNHKMEEVLFSWYKKAQAEKISITDAQIVAVARKIGERLKVPDSFAYSYNWLSGFKIRMGITSRASVTGRKIKSKVAGRRRLSPAEVALKALQTRTSGDAANQKPDVLGIGILDVATSPLDDPGVVSAFNADIKMEPPDSDNDEEDEAETEDLANQPDTHPSEEDNSNSASTTDLYKVYMNAMDEETELEEGGLQMDCEPGFSPADTGLIAHPSAAEPLSSIVTASTSSKQTSRSPGASTSVKLPGLISELVRTAVQNALPKPKKVPSKRPAVSVNTQMHFKRPKCKLFQSEECFRLCT